MMILTLVMMTRDYFMFGFDRESIRGDNFGYGKK